MNRIPDNGITGSKIDTISHLLSYTKFYLHLSWPVCSNQESVMISFTSREQSLLCQPLKFPIMVWCSPNFGIKRFFSWLHDPAVFSSEKSPDPPLHSLKKGIYQTIESPHAGGWICERRIRGMSIQDFFASFFAFFGMVCIIIWLIHHCIQFHHSHYHMAWIFFQSIQIVCSQLKFSPPMQPRFDLRTAEYHQWRSACIAIAKVTGPGLCECLGAVCTDFDCVGFRGSTRMVGIALTKADC